MKYGIVSIKPKPFEIPVLPAPTFIDGKLLTFIFKYPSSDNPNLYPLMIDWKYRLFHKGKHLSTYMAETKFIIEDDGVPIEPDELDRFIGDLYINVEMGWEDQTRNTPLHGTTLPRLIGENLNQVRKQIFDMMQ